MKIFIGKGLNTFKQIMNNDGIIRNADRYQQGMQISGTPQTVNVGNILNQQRQEKFKGAFPLEPFPLQAITTKLEDIVIEFKDVVVYINQLKHNPVIDKNKQKQLQQLIENIKKITKATINSVKFLDKVIE